MPPSRLRLPAVLIATMLLATIGAVVVGRALVARLPTPAVSPMSSAPVATAAPAVDRTPEIRGRILDADGNPVIGAAVRLAFHGCPTR